MTVCVSLDEQPSAHPWIGVRCEHVGLLPLRQEQTPGDREHATAMYAAWIAHEAELRAELLVRAVDELIDEARSLGGRLARMRRVLVVAER